MINFLKKPVIIISLAILIGGIVGGYAYFDGNDTPKYDFIIAEKHNLIQEVNVTGRVKPAENADLAFEKTGKIYRVYTNINDKVNIGQILITLDNAEISAQLAQAEASIEKDLAKLTELEKGTKTEEILVQEVKIANAEATLSNAKSNRENINEKANADLRKEYDGSLTASIKSLNIAINALLTLTDLQNSHFSGFDQQGVQVSDAKAAAVEKLLGATGAGRAPRDYLSQLSGGAKSKVLSAQENATHENIDKMLSDLKSALISVKTALDAIPVLINFTSTETTNLNAEKNNIAEELITIAAKQQTIKVQQAINQSNIASAEVAVNDASNLLTLAKQELTLKKAGATEEQINAQKAQVKETKANAKYYRAQLSKTILRAPINGTITKQNAKIGEIISANTIIISIISETKFEIKANIPEADIAEVEIGNTAIVTLDAYGQDTFFETKVIAIDPAETMIDGVATYITTLQFIKNDERVKSGMTANIDITSDSKENTIAVPQRAIIRKNGDQFVRILNDENFEEVKVKTGLRGSDGNIEIIEGVNEGDKIITFSEK